MTYSNGRLERDGWAFEGPDESVGIFGESIVHEACGNEDEAIVVEVDTSANTDLRLVTITTTLECPKCRARTSYTDEEPLGETVTDEASVLLDRLREDEEGS